MSACCEDYRETIRELERKLAEAELVIEMAYRAPNNHECDKVLSDYEASKGE